MPTACELAGVAAPNDIDGLSYASSLLGDADAQAKHEYLYWASQEGATSVGVRFGDWKLVKYRGKRNNKQPRDAKEDWRLYDLTKDLGEEHDLAAQHPELVAKILQLLKRDGLR